MITKRQLVEISKKTDLNLYQQEKDYLLKLFLYKYYHKHDDAIFKGGTCIKYLYGLNRFSEDLDFNLKNTPTEFEKQVKNTLNNIRALGIESHFTKKELFPDAFTCEIAFQGPLYTTDRTRNKFRIDAGKRTGTITEPRWRIVNSEYPETPPNYLVLAMDEQEMLAEKIIALAKRGKGRDLYDTWFLSQKGVRLDKKLLNLKTKKENIQIDVDALPSDTEYERDITRLTSHVIPYEQVKKEVMQILKVVSKANSHIYPRH